MNFKTVAKGILKSSKNKHDLATAETTALAQSKSKFSFKLYVLITTLLLGTVAGINWLVDPLWYRSGNIVTGKNFAFNERITKSNVFLRTKEEINYDCVILGSSRVIAMKVSNFQDNKCFNYGMKGGEIEDFVDYAKFLKEVGLNPQKVYIGVDGLNFVAKERKNREPFDINQVATQSPLQAYLSADVFMFSVMTLLGVSPDPGNYYDRNFEPVDFDNPPQYRPDFYRPLPPQKCDLSIVKPFADLRTIFPNAEFIGYVPPRSAWSIVNDTYGRDLMDCYLQAFYQLSQVYDAMYDFSVPSEITKNPQHTFDGSHYSVKVNDKIAAIVQGKEPSFGLRVDNYDYEQYHQLYFGQIREFLAENNQMQRWKK
ncbi:MAG: hypothetical protein ACFCU5_11580 [Pleurocapsa sp.]